jgi:diguanylate cyclase (GGDEF)-like protein/PAS domain S-box-containing protein
MDQLARPPAFVLSPREAEDLLEAAERMAQLGHWFLDVSTQRPIWSKQVFAIFARDPALGEPLFAEHQRYLDADGWRRLEQAATACSADGTSYDLTLRIHREDGSDGFARIYSTAVREPDGAIRKLVGFIQDVSEQQADEDALRASEAHYRLLVEQQSDLVVKIDSDGRFLFVSPGYCRTFGKTEQELIGHRFLPLVHPDDRAATEAAMTDLYRPPHRCYLEQRAMTQHGWRWIGWSDSAILDERGEVTAIIGVGRDIHEHKLAEMALVQTKRMLDLALETSGIGTYTADLTTGGVVVDERYLEHIGYKPGEVKIDFDWWRNNVHPTDLASFAEQSDQVMYGGLDDFIAEYRLRHRDGHWVWIQDHARIYERDPDGRALASSGLHIDITRRKEAELKLAYNADHDPLTDLLNRRGMWRAIRRVHAQCNRGQRPYCIAILDLDLFKQVNDVHGHLTGDRLLRETALLLRNNTREADWIGRWGGEEFLILMPDTSAEQAVVLIERLREQVAGTQFDIHDSQLEITTSAGIATCSLRSDTQDDVVNRADRALYLAKQEGRNRVCTEADLTDAGNRADT